MAGGGGGGGGWSRNWGAFNFCWMEYGGPSIFVGWNMGGLKMPKDDLGGVLKFLLSSIPTEQHDA